MATPTAEGGKPAAATPDSIAGDSVASADAVPSALNSASLRRRAPTRIEIPTIPLRVIMNAAKTVSRARVAVSPESPETIRVTISPTSMTVTATARTSDPKGSPTRWATTSAWWTAERTAATSRTPTATSTAVPGFVG